MCPRSQQVVTRANLKKSIERIENNERKPTKPPIQYSMQFLIFRYKVNTQNCSQLLLIKVLFFFFFFSIPSLEVLEHTARWRSDQTQCKHFHIQVLFSASTPWNVFSDSLGYHCKQKILLAIREGVSSSSSSSFQMTAEKTGEKFYVWAWNLIQAAYPYAEYPAEEWH